MKGHEHPLFRFGDLVLVPSERLLLRNGQALAIGGKPFDLLVALVQNAGHLLTKEELLARVWPGLVVEEVNLSVNVSALRKILAQSPGGAEWIETVARQGYRFNARVEVSDAATENLAKLRGVGDSYALRGPQAPVARPTRARWFAVGAALVLALAIAIAYRALKDAPLPVSPSGSVAAYQEYLQARFHWNKRSESSLRRSIGHFRRAIELDPRFALAHAGLANAHTTLGYLGHAPPVSTFPVARPHALKALELDPSLAEAHASLGYIKFYFDWDWAGAHEEFRRALALNPADPVSHQWYAVYLLAAGRSDEALREVQAAHRLDPASLAINTDIGFHHYYNGRYPEAIAQLKTVLGMDRDFALAHLWLARAYLQAGYVDEALAETAFLENHPLRDWPVIVAARGFAFGVAGKPDEARAALDRMKALSEQRFVTAYGVALIHAGLGHRDEAFQWLEKAFDERSHWLVWLRLDPRWKNIRDDPRFAAMVERLKYPA
jgi:DNA-binding winged helix-turn-helix (wHTH) protein